MSPAADETRTDEAAHAIDEPEAVAAAPPAEPPPVEPPLPEAPVDAAPAPHPPAAGGDAPPAEASDPTQPTAAPEPTVPADVLARLERIEESTTLIARDRTLIDRLHAEVQVLRRGELLEAQSPLVRDVIRLTDDIERLRVVSAADDDLDLIGRRVVEILARAGVVPYAPEPGQPFDASLHNGVRRVPVQDEALSRTVAAVLKPGFRNQDGRVVRPADVEVHHYDARAPAAQEGSR